jgi:hypothetical protein
MFCLWFVIFCCLIVVLQSATIDTLGKRTTHSTLPSKDSFVNKINANDLKSTGEGSGANLDDYDDEDEQLVKITTTTILSSTKHVLTTVTSMRSSTIKPAKKNISSNMNYDLDDNEFKDDFSDDLEESAYDHDLTSLENAPLFSSTSYSTTITKIPANIVSQSSIRTFFRFLSRPPIAAGILVGK